MGKADEEGDIFSKHPQFLFCAEASLMCMAAGKKLYGLKKCSWIVQKVDIIFLSASKS